MKTVVKRPSYDTGEGADKAFWISFADLMTALMVLFLMVMAVALLSITKSQSTPVASAPAKPAKPVPAPVPDEPRAQPSAEAEAVKKLMAQLAQAVDATPGVQLDARRHVIDFGDQARFPTGSHQLDADSARLLREFVPKLLAVTESELGRRWVNRVVVEGFADSRGDYLFNLNLSLQRAQRVLCSLLDAPNDGSALSPEQRVQTSDIFAVGGFSFNDQRASLDASRRIELRIEFGPRPNSGATAGPASDAGLSTPRQRDYGACRLPG
jgi:outer membrane protein OmpA-like peptidoglycan-associated protein